MAIGSRLFGCRGGRFSAVGRFDLWRLLAVVGLAIGITVQANGEFCIDVRGVVWEDLNGDGVRDEGEPGIEGVLVRLQTSPYTAYTPCSLASPNLSTRTDARGEYTLSFHDADEHRDPVEYWVELPDLVHGWPRLEFVPTLMERGGDQMRDSNVFEEGAEYGATRRRLVPSAASQITGIDFGLVRTPDTSGSGVGHVRGRAFLAQSDGTEPPEGDGMSGVRVHLMTPYRTLLQSTVTDAEGRYSFEAGPGTYLLMFDSPQRRVPYASSSAMTDPKRSSAITENGATYPFILRAGESLDHINAGYSAIIDISFSVWQDVDGNGIRETGEPPVSGIIVQLWTADGTRHISSARTGADGAVLFPNITHLEPYRITVPLRTPRDSYSPTGAGDDPDLDSDIAADGEFAGFTPVIRLDPGSDLRRAGQAGIVSVPTDKRLFGGRVFVAGPGGMDREHGTPLPGVEVSLGSGRSIFTDEQGNYAFELSSEAEITIRCWFTVPDGYYPDPRVQEIEFVAGRTHQPRAPYDWAMTPWITLPESTVRLDIDVGFVALTRLSGRIWHDENANGLQDTGESSLRGVPVTVAMIDPPQTQWETTTEADGRFHVICPSAASFRLQAFRPFLGDVFSPKNAGDPAFDSDFHADGPDLGFSDIVAVPANAPSMDSIDAGLILAPPPREVLPFQIESLAFASTSGFTLHLSGPIGGTYRLQHWSVTGREWTDIGAPFVTTAAVTPIELASPPDPAPGFWRVQRLQ